MRHTGVYYNPKLNLIGELSGEFLILNFAPHHYKTLSDAIYFNSVSHEWVYVGDL